MKLKQNIIFIFVKPYKKKKKKKIKKIEEKKEKISTTFIQKNKKY